MKPVVNSKACGTDGELKLRALVPWAAMGHVGGGEPGGSAKQTW